MASDRPRMLGTKAGITLEQFWAIFDGWSAFRATKEGMQVYKRGRQVWDLCFVDRAETGPRKRGKTWVAMEFEINLN